MRRLTSNRQGSTHGPEELGPIEAVATDRDKRMADTETHLHWHEPRCSESQTLRAALVLATILAMLAFGTLASAQSEVATGSVSDREEPLTRAQVLELLKEFPLIDGHNDVPWQYRIRVRNQIDRLPFDDTRAADPPMHTDLSRLANSGLGGQFWSIYVPTSVRGPAAVRDTFEQIDVMKRLISRHSDRLELALTAEDVRRIHAAGRLASLLGVEGGHSIDNSLGVLRQLYDAGARYMTLTHSANTDWADSATDDARHNGLTEFGRAVVREMNRLGMLVDLSHVSPRAMHDTLDTAQVPVIFSHSSAHTVTAHARNVPDDVLERLPDNGGVIMVTFVPEFVSETVRSRSKRLQLTRLRLARAHGSEQARPLIEDWISANPRPRATLSDVADHFDYIRDRIGIDYLGVGSDFDGISSTPDGLEDVADLPDLFVELSRRGYSKEDLAKIAGGNLLRALEAAQDYAERARQTPPAEVHIDNVGATGSREP